MYQPEVQVEIGDSVIYFDDDKRPHHAVVAFVYNEEHQPHGRPRVALSWLGYEGRWKNLKFCEPAYHNGELWVLLQKWAPHGLVPKEDQRLATLQY